MAEKHQENWVDHLPFVLLGRRVALQEDIQASASELTFGMNVRIPGQLLHDPEIIKILSGDQKSICGTLFTFIHKTTTMLLQSLLVFSAQ